MNLKPIMSFAKKNAPAILKGMAAAGIISLIPLSARAGVKHDVRPRIANKKKETLLTIKEFALPAAIAAGSIAAIIISDHITNKNLKAALSTAAASARLLKGREEKIKEIFGEEGLKKVKEAQADSCEEVYCAVPKYISNGSMFSKFDNIKTYDDHEDEIYLEYEDMKFMGSKAGVLAALYFINRNFTYRSYCSLLELYEMLGIEDCPFIDKDACEKIGWDSEDLVNNYEAYFIDFDFTQVEGEDHKYILSFPYPPRLLDDSYNM